MVVALPRGGVVTGFEVAHHLNKPLDVITVRKLGAPGRSELGIGAIAPGGVRVLDSGTIAALGVSQQYISDIENLEREEMNRRLELYRGRTDYSNLTGKVAILVDDGLATGVTASAAIVALRSFEPAAIVLAVPVCSQEAAARLSRQVDEFVSLQSPHDFQAVGLWYQHFAQTTDDEVMALLEQARREPGNGTVFC